MSKKVCVRTNSNWLQITLIDTMFNKIYFCLKKQPIDTYGIQSTLNQFYNPNSIAGRAVYNNENITQHGDINSYVNLKDWKYALKVRINLYRYIRKIINSNKFSKPVREYCYRYLLGIQDILRNIFII